MLARLKLCLRADVHAVITCKLTFSMFEDDDPQVPCCRRGWRQELGHNWYCNHAIQGSKQDLVASAASYHHHVHRMQTVDMLSAPA